MASLAVLCLFFFGTGVLALVCPERIRDWMLKAYETSVGIGRWNPFVEWVKTSNYLISLRIVGGLSILAGCFLLSVLRE
jgi:uncharacterized protein YjeT (DUF2065 family)